MHTIIFNLNHYNWFVSKIGYIDFVPLSGKLPLELEFKDMKQTQYVDKTSLSLNPFEILIKKKNHLFSPLRHHYIIAVLRTFYSSSQNVVLC